MDQHRFDILTRSLSGIPSRRRLLRGLAGTGLGLGFGAARLADDGEARKKGKSRAKGGDDGNGKGKSKPKPRKGLCARNGSKCRTPGNNCKKKYCLNAPFTITAAWTKTADHDTFFFVPPEDETTGPSPYIDYGCNQSEETCEDEYPFACVDGDETKAGDEVTTVYQLLPGTYEYWVESYLTSAGDVTVTLRDQSGRVVREWENPANPIDEERGWHVFDIDGEIGAVKSVDALNAEAESLPEGAHDPYTDVCA